MAPVLSHLKKKDMEIKELRVGNLLYRNGIMEVLGIGANNKLIIYDHYNKERLPYGLDVASFKGIELTPEWLEKFKFNKHHYLGHDIMWRHPNDKKTVEETLHSCNFYWQDKKFVFIEVVNDHGEYATFPVGHIKYIHQLQNLYFALTGEELAIDKTSLKN